MLIHNSRLSKNKHFWWLIRVTLVVAFGFLLQTFSEVAGTYDLSFCMKLDLCHTRSLTRVPSMLVHKYMDETPWLPCWPPRGQQVLHQRWILGICCPQAMKHATEGIHTGFETQGRHHQKQDYQWFHKKAILCSTNPFKKKYLQGTIATGTLNPIQPISCDKKSLA